MPTVYYPTSETKRVKDLEWLLEHKHQITSIEVLGYVVPSIHQGFMRVYYMGDQIFHINWLSLRACTQWLSRPSLKDVPLFWINHNTTCGALDFGDQ